MRFSIFLGLLLTATVSYAQDNIILRNGEEIPAKVLEINQNDLKYRKSANLDGPIYTAPLRDVLLIKYVNGTKDIFGTEGSPLLVKPVATESSAATSPAGATASLDGLRYRRGMFSRYYSDANGQRIGMSEAKSVFSTQTDALNAFSRGRSLRCWSVATAIPAVLMIGAGAGLSAFDSEGGGRGRDGSRNDQTNDDNDNNNRNGRGNGAMMGAAVAGTGVLLGVASIWLDHRASVQFRRAANRYNNRTATSLRFAPSRRGVGVGAVLTF